MKTLITKTTVTFFALILTVCYARSQDTIVLCPGPADGYMVYVNDYAIDFHGPTSETFLSCYWTIGGIPGVGRSFMKFNLPSLPEGSTLVSAKLSLYYFQGNNAPNTGNNSSWLMRVTEPWIPDFTYWFNQPAATTADMITLPDADPYVDFPDIDFTPFVEYWMEQPDSNFGFMIRLVDETEIYTCLTVGSPYASSSLRPKLEIVYYPCNSSPGFTYDIVSPVVSFSDTTNGSFAWMWDFGDGFFSNLQNPVHAYNAVGTYYVCLAVANTCGVDTVCDSVRVSPSGISEIGPSGLFAVSPNPTVGIFTLRCPEQIMGDIQYRLITVGGQELLNRQLLQVSPCQLFSVDPGSLTPGIYMIEVKTKQGMQTLRLVVRKE